MVEQITKWVVIKLVDDRAYSMVQYLLPIGSRIKRRDVELIKIVKLLSKNDKSVQHFANCIFKKFNTVILEKKSTLQQL